MPRQRGKAKTWHTETERLARQLDEQIDWLEKRLARILREGE